MSLRKKRPVNLNLLTIQLPVAGIMSIAHRLSGVMMFCLIPWVLFLLDLSLRGPEGFAQAKVLLHTGWLKLVWVAVVWALAHHFLAGLRYLLLDLDIGLEKPFYRYSAIAVLAGGGLAALLAVGVLL